MAAGGTVGPLGEEDANVAFHGGPRSFSQSSLKDFYRQKALVSVL